MSKDVDFYASLGFSSITSFGCYWGPDYDQIYGTPPIEAHGSIPSGV